MPKPSYRNHRNTPYVIDEFTGRLHRSAAGVAWRFRTELLSLTGAGAGFTALTHVLTITRALVALAGGLAVVMLLPWTRRFLVRRSWCVLSRHRIQRVCFETRMHTRSGRLPLVLRISPTEVGEKALIWCRAGICFEDFEAHAPEIAAACYAREARMEKSRRWAQIITVHVVRRDTLAARNIIAPALAPGQITKRDSGTAA